MNRRSWYLLALLSSVAAGAQLHTVGLRIEPGRRVLQNAGSHQQLLALGAYEDGNESDLTDQAKWTDRTRVWLRLRLVAC